MTLAPTLPGSRPTPAESRVRCRCVPVFGSAVDRCTKGATCIDEPRRRERALALHEVCLWHDTEVVEAHCTLCRHAVGWAQWEFGGYGPHGASHRRGENAE